MCSPPTNSAAFASPAPPSWRNPSRLPHHGGNLSPSACRNALDRQGVFVRYRARPNCAQWLCDFSPPSSMGRGRGRGWNLPENAPCHPFATRSFFSHVQFNSPPPSQRSCGLAVSPTARRRYGNSSAHNRLLVIAPASISLRAHRTVAPKRKLLPTELKLLETILQTSTGADDPEKLKHFLSYDQWRTNHLGYALLAGDYDVMPVRLAVLDRVTRRRSITRSIRAISII